VAFSTAWRTSRPRKITITILRARKTRSRHGIYAIAKIIWWKARQSHTVKRQIPLTVGDFLETVRDPEFDEYGNPEGEGYNEPGIKYNNIMELENDLLGIGRAGW
jgi:hypothetical protein